MPDFERITDSLFLHHAQTPEKKAEMRGYSRGKTIARIQVAVIFAISAFVYVLAADYFRSTAHENTPKAVAYKAAKYASLSSK